MWELKFDSNDKPMFGCLNPACKSNLMATFSSSFFLLIGYCLKLTGVTFLSVGLAVHT